MKIVSDNQLDPNVLNVFYSAPQTPEWFDDFFYQKVVTENTGDSLPGKRFYEIDNYTIQYDLYDKHSPLLYKKQIFIDDTFHLQKSITTDYENITIDSLTNYSFILNKATAVLGAYNYINDRLIIIIALPLQFIRDTRQGIF